MMGGGPSGSVQDASSGPLWLHVATPYRKTMTRRSATLCGVLSAILLTATAHADSIISNGNFEHGLTDWTAFTTPNGTLGAGEPQVLAFSPDNVNTVNAAQFQVGQTTSGGTLEGGGIFQNVTLPGGFIQLSADIGAQGGTSSNLFGGFAQLLIDMHPVAGYDFGALQAGEIKTATLNVDEFVASGQHTVAVEFLRPAASDSTTPYQYFYNFQADDEAPEPSTVGLLLAGLAFLAMRGRSRFGRSARPRVLGQP